MLKRNLNGNQLSKMAGVNRSFCLPNRKIKRSSEPFYPEPQNIKARKLEIALNKAFRVFGEPIFCFATHI